MIKNKQLQITREIDKTQGRIGDLQLDIDTEGMRIAELMDRYALRAALARIDSQLEPLTPGMVEVIDLVAPSPEDVVAQNDFR